MAILHVETPAGSRTRLLDGYAEHGLYGVSGRVTIDGTAHGSGAMLVLADAD